MFQHSSHENRKRRCFQTIFRKPRVRLFIKKVIKPNLLSFADPKKKGKGTLRGQKQSKFQKLCLFFRSTFGNILMRGGDMRGLKGGERKKINIFSYSIFV